MINLTSGDILKSDNEAIVNTVNCVGVMGRGIALQFKRAWPENFKEYKKACDKGLVKPGEMFIFETGQLTNPKYIINFPTKRHWRGSSKIEDIESGLKSLSKEIKRLSIKSIAIPPLGSGLGGLDWDIVKKIIIGSLSDFTDTQVNLFEPKGAPSSGKMAKHKKPPQMTSGRAVLVGLINKYLEGLLDPNISLLEVHKLMYFMQVDGEPLKLKYEKAPFGPYAQNLRFVLDAIEGYFISGYADGGDAPTKVLSLINGSVEKANNVLNSNIETLSRFKNVANLVEGFETPNGLELLASVHWLEKNEKINSDDELVEQMYSWGTEKKKFTKRQILIAKNTLIEKNWLKA